MDTKGKGGWEGLGEWDWCIYTVDTVYKIDDWWELTALHGDLCFLFSGDLKRMEVPKEGIQVHLWPIHSAAKQSLTALQSNQTPAKH